MVVKPAWRMPAYTLFLTLGAWIAFFVTLGSPSDPKNSFLFGYSLERLILGGGMLVLALALLFLTGNLVRRPEYSLRLWEMLTSHTYQGNLVLAASLVVFLICWVLLFLPSYRLGVVAGYLNRLLPIIIWLAVTSAVTVLLLLVVRSRTLPHPLKWLERSSIIVTVAVFAIFMAAGAVMLVTGLGIRIPEDYWYAAGVPTLGLQVLLSLVAGGFVLGFESRRGVKHEARLDVLLFFVFWLVSAWLWARQPLSPNYFMPDTADNPIYPYSDGATFDQGAQFALIGQGIFNSQYFERSLYSIFLTYLHMWVGQDFTSLMTAQAAIFAVFPAVTYLLGKELHSRALGVSAGMLLAMRGMNAIIAARWIDTASPKMALTDFPAAIGVAVFLFVLVKWLKSPSRFGLLLWVGAVFALTLMVRSNVLTLLPAVFVCLPFFIKVRWRQFVLAGLLLLVGMVTVTLPWEIRNQSKGIPMYSSYYSRLIMIFRSRYNLDAETSIPPREAAVTGLARQRVRAGTSDLACDSIPCDIANHFLHNVATSFASLPSSFVFDDLWNTIKADTPYWKSDWREGSVGTVGAVFIILNLALISLGVGSVWGRSRVLTLMPILIFAAYLFTNSIALTSGGRYVAPVDWIVYLFFMAGGLQLVAWLMGTSGILPQSEAVSYERAGLPSLNREALRAALPSLALILAVGMLLPISEMPFSPRYQVRQPEEILGSLDEAGLLQQTGFSRDELLAFLSQPDAMIREGRALYPRYYPSGDGEQDRSTYYRYLDYQRLVFTLIGPYSAVHEGVVIPGFAPSISFHAEDVIVLGCRNTTYYAPFIDAVAVISTSGEGYVYAREPGAPLQCPLPEPKP